MGIVDKIKEKYPYLTRKQRDVANYMLEDVERMSYVTLKEVARDSGVTEMTVLKTCALLGFSSFSDLKYEFRKYAARQLEYTRHLDVEYNTPRIPGYELSNTEALLQDICLFCRKLIRHLNNQCYVMITTYILIPQRRYTLALQRNPGICLCARTDRIVHRSIDRIDLNRTTQCCLCKCNWF